MAILCLYDDLGQINVIAGILKLRKRFRMSQILFEHGINSLPLVCFRGYGNLSTPSIAIPRAAEDINELPQQLGIYVKGRHTLTGNKHLNWASQSSAGSLLPKYQLGA